MLKIAVIYSGNLRSLNLVQCSHVKFLDNLKLSNDVKIFCQTWNTIESETTSWWSKKNSKSEYDKFYISETIHQILNPVDFSLSILEETILHNKPFFFKSKISYDGIFSMLKANYYAWILLQDYIKKENWIPDIVIKIRYDIDFDFEEFNLNLKSVYKQNKILTFTSFNWAFTNSYSDIFIAFKYENAKLFYTAFEKFTNNDYLEKYFENYTLFVPELFYFKYILKECLVININENLNIIRIGGSNVTICEKINIFSSNDRLNYFIKLNSYRHNIYQSSVQLINDLEVFLEINNLLYFKYLFDKNLTLFNFIALFVKCLQNRRLLKIFFQLLKIKIHYSSILENQSLFNKIFLYHSIIILKIKNIF